jgi:hypothetical protein
MSSDTDELNSHIDFIVSETTNHFQSTSNPILLSELGLRFAAKWGPFRKKYKMSLQEFVDYYLEDKIVVDNFPGVRQKIYAIPATDYEIFKKKTDGVMPAESAAAEFIAPSQSNPLRKFPRAFVFAFQRDIQPEKRRFISKRRPIRYRDSIESPSPTEDWVELKKKYVEVQPLLKSFDQMSPGETESYKKKIDEWLTSEDLDARNFFFIPSESTQRNIQQGQDVRLLRELIDAQPREVQENLLIPAKLIKKLMGI